MNDLISLEKIAQWQKLKTLVLDSVLSDYGTCLQHGTRCIYGMVPEGAAAGVSPRRRSSSSIIIRMSAIRKLVAEAADDGLLAPELAADISRVKER
jgi:hypothetical protein